MSQFYLPTEQAGIGLLLQLPNKWPSYNGYEPLDPESKEIRLLRIWHRPDDDTIHGELKHENLNSGLRYEALSYCWGPPSKELPLYIDDHPVSVRETLWNFLYSLCRHKQELPVWLDAICINQRDLAEKSLQVRLMGQIFAQASQTIAWIGDPDHDSEYALAFLARRMHNVIQVCDHFDAIKNKALEGIWQLMQRPYWRRLWVVQELGLASQVLIICGSRRIDLETLSSAIDLTGGHQNMVQLMETRKLLVPASDPTTEIRTSVGDSGTLLELMSSYGRRLCEDPKDKIFALLNLATDRKTLPFDYARGLGDLLFDVVRSFLYHMIESEIFDVEGRDKEGLTILTELASRNLSLAQKTLSAALIETGLSFPALVNSMLDTDELEVLTSICVPEKLSFPTIMDYSVDFNRWTDYEACQEFDSGGEVSEIFITSNLGSFTENDNLRRSRSWYFFISAADSLISSDVIVQVHGIQNDAPHIAIRLTDKGPSIIGALDFTDRKPFCAILEPPRRVLLWFILLNAGEIIVCRKLSLRDIWDGVQDKRSRFVIPLHYSRFAILALCIPKLHPSVISEHLKEHRARQPLTSLCRCDVDNVANMKLINWLRRVLEERPLQFYERRSRQSRRGESMDSKLSP